MPLLYVTEFQGNFSGLQLVLTPPITDQTPVNFGSGVASSAAFQSFTRIVRLEADSICSIAWGTNPTATTSNMRLAAGMPEYFAVQGGQKVSVISNT